MMNYLHLLLKHPQRKWLALVTIWMLYSRGVIAQQDTTSYIQTLDISTGKLDTILIAKGDFEAPNWHPDNYLVPNFRGKMYKLDLATKQLSVINTGSIPFLMDDHGISPDGKLLAITDFDRRGGSFETFKFTIYTVPATGGEPKRLTFGPLAFYHGWSPDGKTITYCGGEKLSADNNLDVYTIPAAGGTPRQLTRTEGLDDGPDYSPDGKYIYFHSYRTKHMQIWRMDPDGSNPTQITFDEHANWFPHPSPDGKWIAYIAYTTDQKQAHPFGKDVKLRLMDIKTKAIKDLTPVFFGGAGTINSPSWSPDSKKIAFISYSVN